MASKSNHYKITFSAPGKIHLLGEHSVVYGKPALLTTVDLRATVTITPTTYNDAIVHMYVKIKKVIESILKKYLKTKTIPPYQLKIDSQLPLGCGLGSSAAISAAYIVALLTFLKAKWDLNLINQLTFEAEKTWHGHPSGADNSAVIFGGLVWFRKETDDLKLIQPLPFTLPLKLTENFILINTGKPKETTKEMVELISSKFILRLRSGQEVQSSKFKKIFDDQEQLTRELLSAIQQSGEKELVRIIKAGEKNLESIGVVSKQVIPIIRQIEKAGGCAKICGGGGITGPTGVLLCYHPTPSRLIETAKKYNLEYFKTSLGVEGLRKE